MRSTSCRAASASVAASSNSTSRPTRVSRDVEAEVLQRAADGLALRVEDPGLRPD